MPTQSFQRSLQVLLCGTVQIKHQAVAERKEPDEEPVALHRRQIASG